MEKTLIWTIFCLSDKALAPRPSTVWMVRPGPDRLQRECQGLLAPPTDGRPMRDWGSSRDMSHLCNTCPMSATQTPNLATGELSGVGPCVSPIINSYIAIIYVDSCSEVSGVDRRGGMVRHVVRLQRLRSLCPNGVPPMAGVGQSLGPSEWADAECSKGANWDRGHYSVQTAGAGMNCPRREFAWGRATARYASDAGGVPPSGGR